MANDTRDLDDYNPKMRKADFYAEYGEDFSEWQEHAEEMFALEEELGYSHNLTPNKYHIFPSRLSPFNIYFINKSLNKIGSGKNIKDIFRKANSFGLRSDELTDKHVGKHIVFAGCSITFGDGVPDEYIWPTLVLDKIKSKSEVSGMFNLAFNGANHVQIFTQVWSYIEKFGNPDILFINFPDIRRLVDAGFETRALYVIAALYNGLHMYCKLAGIKLISFSWDTEINIGAPDYLTNQMFFPIHNDPRSYFADTFHKFDVQDRQRFMFEYEQENADNEYKDFFVRALDIVHPGLAEQAFYADFALKCLGDF